MSRAAEVDRTVQMCAVLSSASQSSQATALTAALQALVDMKRENPEISCPAAQQPQVFLEAAGGAVVVVVVCGAALGGASPALAPASETIDMCFGFEVD